MARFDSYLNVAAAEQALRQQGFQKSGDRWHHSDGSTAGVTEASNGQALVTYSPGRSTGIKG